MLGLDARMSMGSPAPINIGGMYELLKQKYNMMFRYVPSCDLNQTDLLLHNLFDVPLYHTMSWDDQDFETICEIIIEEAEKLLNI